jgi:hypothetical protein
VVERSAHANLLFRTQFAACAGQLTGYDARQSMSFVR